MGKEEGTWDKCTMPWDRGKCPRKCPGTSGHGQCPGTRVQCSRTSWQCPGKCPGTNGHGQCPRTSVQCPGTSRQCLGKGPGTTWDVLGESDPLLGCPTDGPGMAPGHPGIAYTSVRMFLIQRANRE